MKLPELTNRQRAALAHRVKRDILAARECPNAFIEFVGIAPGGKRVRQGAVHREWQQHLTDNDKAIIRAPVGFGKSSQLRWRILWELGRNPNLRIAIVSVSKEGNPKKFLDSLKAEITTNDRLHLVFPNLKPQANPRDWSGFRATVERADKSEPNPTFQLFGLSGKILGTRLDLIVADDLHNNENSLTSASREKIFKWFTSEVLSRRPQQGGGRAWIIGHRWHKDDALERMEKEIGFAAINYSAFVENPETGEEESLIPYITGIDHLRELERDLGVMAGPMLRNRLSDLDKARFRREWFDRALTAGTGLSLVDHWNPSDSPTFSGIDLSTGGPKGDFSCIVTFTVLPDGSRRLLDIRKGRWRAPEIVENATEVYNRFGPLFFVEGNAQQQLFIDGSSELQALPIKKFYTGMNKWSLQFGVESFAHELANGQWILPNMREELVIDDDTGKPVKKMVEGPAPILNEWISEHIGFVPDPKQHTSDLVMATWFARERARQAGCGHDGWMDWDDDGYFDVDTLVR